MPYFDDEYSDSFDMGEVLELAGITTQELGMVDDVIKGGYDKEIMDARILEALYEPDASRKLSPSTSKTRTEMAPNQLAADISQEKQIRVKDNADEIGEIVAKDILDKTFQGIAWEHGATRAIDAYYATQGKTIFNKRKSTVLFKKKSNAKMSLGFEIDTSDADKFIADLSNARLLTEDNIKNLKEIVYDNTAHEMAKSTIYDLLIEKHRPKSEALQKRRPRLATTFARYNQVLNQSFLMLCYVDEIIISQSLSEFKNLGYKEDIIRRIEVFLSESHRKILEFRSTVKSLLRESREITANNQRLKATMDIKLDIKVLYLLMQTLYNDLKLFFNDIVNFVERNDIMRFIWEKESNPKFSKYISGGQKLIFDIMKGITREIMVNMDQIIQSLDYNTKRFSQKEEIGPKHPMNIKFDKRPTVNPSKFEMNPEHPGMTPINENLFELDILPSSDELAMVFHMADSLEVSFKALGISSKFVREIRKKVSNVVFNRIGLDRSVEKFMMSAINSNLDRVINK